MNAADNLSTLTHLITQSCHCVEQLKDCLGNELNYLETNNAKELIQISQNKESLMLELHTLDLQRKNLIAENNIKTKEEYIQWLAQLDPSLELKNQWLKLSEGIIDCQQMNTKNGIITDSMTSASRQALNILNGSNEIPNSTYTAVGKKSDTPNSLHKTTA